MKGKEKKKKRADAVFTATLISLGELISQFISLVPLEGLAVEELDASRLVSPETKSYPIIGLV